MQLWAVGLVLIILQANIQHTDRGSVLYHEMLRKSTIGPISETTGVTSGVNDRQLPQNSPKIRTCDMCCSSAVIYRFIFSLL